MTTSNDIHGAEDSKAIDDMDSIDRALAAVHARLRDSRDERGVYCGELSSSALSTATASIAFELTARAASPDSERHRTAASVARRGRHWLRCNQNNDGGFGDTIDSPSNISTTVLAWVALGFGDKDNDDEAATSDAASRVEAHVRAAVGSLEPGDLARTIRQRYGKDKTFSVPILMTCALGGKLGDGRHAWSDVPALPYELAACPHRWFEWLRLPMVSYALPALIAIGQVRHHHRPTWNPITRLARRLTREKTRRKLREIQPSSGGYLEAAPLTSFVVMSLVSMELHDHAVVHEGLRFLTKSIRDDGSWPIDTNLDTWTTTLTIGALAASDANVPAGDGANAGTWLLGQQYRERHPFTHAAPGGWAWTDLPGGVPDADDTAGALVALRHLHDGSGARTDGDVGDDPNILSAITPGVMWLLDLQNRDGGIPTFCRGWGALPFDRSTPDLTAHALRAWTAWRADVDVLRRERIDRAMSRAVAYLRRIQRTDGAWIPLWFGHQSEAREENPLYGTSRVMRAITSTLLLDGDPDLVLDWGDADARALRFLLGTQHATGGFGTSAGVDPTVEETALAVETLSERLIHRHATSSHDDVDDAILEAAVRRGVSWLLDVTDGGTRFTAAPIGLYFAKLWYSEKLYPPIFTASALGFARRMITVRRNEAPVGTGGS